MDFPENPISNASHQYSYRVPSPPRIFVPPPIQTSIDSPSTRNGPLTALQPLDIWPNTTFLTGRPLVSSHGKDYVLDWTYDQRQNAQQILPFLYLGPLAAARDKTFLQSKQITMVLGVRRVTDAFMMNPKAPRDLGLEMQFVDVKTEGQSIGSYIQLVTKINEHLERRFQGSREQHDHSNPPGRVLVFCESGNERSATAVAAYIMAIYGVDVVEAIQAVQAERFCVNIDDAARIRLDTYGNMLRAQMDIYRANGGQTTEHRQRSGLGHLTVSHGNLSRKRSAERMMEDDDDDEMTGTEMYDDIKRDGSAPFFDEAPNDD